MFYMNKVLLFILILFARIFLDSIPSVTYPKSAFGLSFMEYFTLCIMVFMLLYLLIHHAFKLDSISKSMLFLFVPMILTSIYHGNITGLIDIGSIWLYFFFAYIFFKHYLKSININSILTAIVILSIYPLLNQLATYISGTGLIHQGHMRYTGTYHHANNIADYLLFSIPAALFLLTSVNKKSVKLLLIFHIILCHFGIYLSGYRTNWLATFLFWLFFILLTAKKKITYLVLFLSIFIVAWQYIGSSITSRLKPIEIIINDPGRTFDLSNSEHDKLLSGRIGIWKNMFRVYQKADAIEIFIGMGIGFTQRTRAFYMHNEYFSAFIETGPLSFGILLLWIYFLLKTILNKIPGNENYPLIVLSIFTSFLLLGLATMPFRHIIVINYLCIYMALLFNKQFYIESNNHIAHTV